MRRDLTKEVLPHKNDGGARRTFQGFKFVDWYRLFVVVELVPPKGGMNLHTPIKQDSGTF